MKLTVSADERYPFFELSETRHYMREPIEITEEFYEKYKRVMGEFEALQKELEELDE